MAGRQGFPHFKSPVHQRAHHGAWGIATGAQHIAGHPVRRDGTHPWLQSQVGQFQSLGVVILACDKSLGAFDA